MKLKVGAGLVMLVTALGAVALITGVFNDDSDEKKGPAVDPRAAALPKPGLGAARATLNYLRAEGAALMKMHGAARDVTPKLGASRCRTLASRLNRSAPSNRVVALTARVEDEPLRAAFSDERTQLGVTLSGCVRGVPEMRNRVQPAASLVEARLVQLRAFR